MSLYEWLRLGALLWLATRPRPPVPPVKPPGPPPSGAPELVLLGLHNKARREAGKPELRLNSKLEGAAQHQARECVAIGELTHTDRQGRKIGERLGMAGYMFQKCAENLAFGRTPEAAWGQWRQSPGHWAHVMDAVLQDVGIAQYEGVWCVVFGRHQSIPGSSRRARDFGSV